MNKTTKIVITVIILAIIVWIIATKGEKPTIQPPVVNQPAAEKLHIASVVSLTGPASFFGQELKNGMDLANGNGALDISYQDSESAPAKGTSAFQQALTVQKPDIAIVALSSVAKAITPIAIENKIPVVQTLVSSSKIAAQSPYTFRYFTSGEQEAPIAADIMINTLKVKKVAAIYTNDEYGLSYFNALKESLESRGVTIVANETILGSDTDFKTQLSKVNAKKPDAIYVIALDKGLAGVIKQAKELKTSAKIVTNWVLSNPAVREMTKDVNEGVYLTAPTYYLGTSTAVKNDFVASYKTKYQKDPSAYAAIGYDLVNILAQVKKMTGDTSENIIQKLTDVKSVKGVMGDLAIDAEGEITFALYPVVIKNGVLVEIK
jgi:branched-chain amino acid transport system substrate-binding protein